MNILEMEVVSSPNTHREAIFHIEICRLRLQTVFDQNFLSTAGRGWFEVCFSSNGFSA